jgi:hypothetical protein
MVKGISLTLSNDQVESTYYENNLSKTKLNCNQSTGRIINLNDDNMPTDDSLAKEVLKNSDIIKENKGINYPK